MKGSVVKIKDLTEDNGDFRQALDTGQYLQRVLTSLKVGADIGPQTHSTHGQFCRIDKGRGEITTNGAG